jgi:hypothetical protein
MTQRLYPGSGPIRSDPVSFGWVPIGYIRSPYKGTGFGTGSIWMESGPDDAPLVGSGGGTHVPL